MVVLGHSGTTGFGSDPSDPTGDARQNSWATGTNPTVGSIYRRLLPGHPALKGHAVSLGEDGSNVDALPGQVAQMLALDPKPDVVLIQSIDNDMRCDGTDPGNETVFAGKLDQVLTTINREDPNAQIFFVDQWSSVQTYAAFSKGDPVAVTNARGTGPCDTFTDVGRLRPAGIISEQEIVDGYFDQIKQVCGRHRACWTDDGAMQELPLRTGDLTVDRNHLSVSGLATMAKYAWAALPDAIKQRK
jgi:hypothetical protein